MNTDDQPRSASQSSASSAASTVDPIVVAKTGSAFDVVLWLVALSLLIGATLVNQYLPAYWAPATDLWTRIGVIVGMLVVAFGCLYVTHQGKGFLGLLKASKVELRRITWPTKQDTFQTTWIVLVVVLIMSLLLWGLDTAFGWLISLIIG